jgi:dolichol-phosphate mannosyltransferase
MKSTIVIPTYNESGNIEKLLRQIFSLRIPNLEVIVVDDNSPDLTAKIVENLSKICPLS